MKLIKFLFKAILAIVVLAVVALLALPLWFGPVGKTVANVVAPKVVKTDFNLGVLSLNPYSGRFELGDMQLANPQGYSEKFAATVGDIVFDCEPLSMATDVIHIEEITVKEIFVSYVSGGENNVNNFKQIQYNVAGGKEKYEAAQAEKEASAQPEGKAEPSAEAPSAPKAEKKVIIDKLTISGLRVKLGFLPIVLPSITLTDIGRKEGGATLADAWQQIVEGVLKAAGVAGDQAKALLGSVGDLTGGAAEGATKAVEGASKAVGEGAKKALDFLNGLK